MNHTKDKASYFEWTICLDNPTSSLRKYGHKRCKGKGVKVVIWTQNVFFFISYTSVADTSWIVYAGWVNGQLTMCTSIYLSWYLIPFLSLVLMLHYLAFSFYICSLNNLEQFFFFNPVAFTRCFPQSQCARQVHTRWT